jgi:hypothetical protein
MPEFPGIIIEAGSEVPTQREDDKDLEEKQNPYGRSEPNACWECFIDYIPLLDPTRMFDEAL